MAQKKESVRTVSADRDSLSQYEQQTAAIRARFWQAVDRIRARNADQDPDEILRTVTGVVEEVRQERYGKAKSAQSGR